ncbi:MAG: hypothetical protein DHS20C20_16360 [Ardenticatenaceae bacterium]|nr:MAG: hypothetical protein DHS20C20_16360 [Ardenticatenaceae bacterium]
MQIIRNRHTFLLIFLAQNQYSIILNLFVKKSKKIMAVQGDLSGLLQRTLKSEENLTGLARKAVKLQKILVNNEPEVGFYLSNS